MTPDTTRTAAGTGDAIAPLRAQTVRPPDEPARCTLSPVEADEAERRTAWLTVDASVVVDLDGMR